MNISVDCKRCLANHSTLILCLAAWWTYSILVLNIRVWYLPASLLHVSASFSVFDALSYFHAATPVFGCVAVVIISRFLKKDLARIARSYWLIWISVASSIGVLILSVLAFIDSYNIDAIAMVVAGALVGSGLSFVQVCIGATQFTCLSKTDVCFVTVASYMIASVGAFIVPKLGVAAIPLTLLFLPVSSALLRRSLSESKKQLTDNPLPTMETIYSSKMLFGVLLVCCCVGFVFGFSRTILANESTSTFSSSVSSYVIVASIFIVLMLGLSTAAKQNYVFILLSLLLLFVTAGIISVSLFGILEMEASFSLITVGIHCADLATWIMVALLCSKTSVAVAAKIFCRWKIATLLGSLLGAVSCNILLSVIDLSPSLIPSLSLFLLLCLLGSISLGVFCLWEPTALVNTAPLAQQDPSAKLCTIAEKAQLSKRETEVFILLAQGRSTPYIAGKLFLANSTVTTYVKRIYSKLGITSKQELLDIVNR